MIFKKVSRKPRGSRRRAVTFLLAEPKRIGVRALGTQTPRIPQESLRRGQLRGLFSVRAPLPGRAAPGLGGRVPMQNHATSELRLQSSFHLKTGDIFCLQDTSGCGYGLQSGKRSLFKSHETQPPSFREPTPPVISEIRGFNHVCFLWPRIQVGGPFIQMHETSHFFKKIFCGV